MSVLIEFLQLVGKSLLKLSIQTVGSGAMDIHAILRACPNLDQLFLDNVSINLDTFMLEVESGDADICCFGLLYYNVPAEAITRFAKKLADPQSALACEMRELCLSADNEVSPMTDENVQAFLNVLKTNDKLVYLDLLVLPPLFDKYAAAFRKHHQETLSIEKEKLPLCCRLAFLSVIRGHLTPVNDVFHHLDNHLLRHIFSFAAVTISLMAFKRDFKDGKWPFSEPKSVPTPTEAASVKISEVLSSADELAGEYSFGGLANTLPSAPGLFVKDVGVVPLPLVPEQAEKLVDRDILDKVEKVFSWKMPYAKNPENVEFENFLRSPEQSTTFKGEMKFDGKLQEFTGFQHAKRFATLSVLKGPEEASFTAEASENRKPIVKITKTRKWFDDSQARLAQYKAEFQRLNEIY
ncbi:hypothetical protein PHPALM_28899 [Phytophthora palmivora]|uniref:Uncharacterized protein n=1 Tax=Phytophthora palmivora TaxID=4796 RepID=A0A2P4X8Z3_9STRA|nr:hypothetical protein PHPALM_28899 [Phytophthora palmivora]